jgi:hypothetical protein
VGQPDDAFRVPLIASLADRFQRLLQLGLGPRQVPPGLVQQRIIAIGSKTVLSLRGRSSPILTGSGCVIK